MNIGQEVEVHTRFDGSWAPGFEIAEITERGYRLRRTSDGMVLPDVTSTTDLRPAWPAPPD